MNKAEFKSKIDTLETKESQDNRETLIFDLKGTESYLNNLTFFFARDHN